MTRFLAILLFIGGLIYGWFFLKKKQAENSAKAVAAQLAPHLSDQPVSPDAAETVKKSEANLYWILFYFDKLATEGRDPATVLSDACEQISMPEQKSSVVRSVLMANYETAKKYRIFEDITNVVKLEQGIPPLMKMTGWEDEPVSVGYIIPPEIAPEAAGATANFVLMPGIVSDAQGPKLTSQMMEQARTMEKAKIITKASLDALMSEFKQQAEGTR